MIRSMRPIGRLAVVGLAVGLSACGSSGTTVEAVEETSTDLTIEDMLDTPLSRLLGFDRAAEQDFAAQQREAENLVAECMAAEGFDYEPEDFGDADFSDPFDDIEEEWGSRAFAEKWGYGIATTFELQQAFDEPVEATEEAAFSDPTEGMSDGERDAYYTALYGGDDGFDSSLTEAELEESFENYEPSGCQAEAQSQVFGSSLFEDVEFGSLMEDLYTRIEADPRIVEAEATWASCMAGKGYSFTDRDEGYQSVSEQMDEVWSSVSDPFEDLSEEDYENLSEDELRALSRQAPDFDTELLAEISEYEIGVAVADYDCGADSLRVYYDVQVELEQQFIDENRETIDRLQGAEG